MEETEFIYAIMYDILLGQLAILHLVMIGIILWKLCIETSFLAGDAEKFLMQQQSALQSAVTQLLSKKKANNIDDLVARGDDDPGESSI
ncbi:putative 28S rRNA (cytosine-C(5))-methyltransferase isoform X2 [Cucumis melo var. makuwa]|uniref:28S rRNA (Cytosine-C(5))-methyltransferase isoform X2 n=1 Tax=Cucumis melo var. makuwa TaxID=1194695 RepID=A0A5A7SP75_CUCMM|nr:putative 28S rRNA (cytosine-C(5))-methyltransferase isoform X2 [Cucumis melo var. makuwa]TYK03430.1 putative 28S rRNA (cytosine-C(5))-methyltransferase isoform X2 [Cucumis melo var. makuwa]